METIKLDLNNQEQLKAFDLIANTNTSFFLTGKAGTGKTTFLKYVIENVNKKFVVLAPTGIAAINAGGETLHSFFGLPFTAIGPRDFLRLRENKINIIQNTDTFIIDEVSMVRCDIIDAIDRSLRKIMYSSLPFGGKQMIFMGDIFQLEPILKSPEDKMLIKDVYNTDKPFFFKANVFTRFNLPSIEFKFNYRQEKDNKFIEILDEIRTGTITESNLLKLNSRVYGKPIEDDFIVTLTGHNSVADKINESNLDKISEKLFVFKAEQTGKISGESRPSELELKIKKGAQVIFTKNDFQGRWANGTLGKVSEVSENLIKVCLENGSEYQVEKTKWDNLEYSYDPIKKTTQQNVVGTFTQYPLKLAWGITIHKSQGLTFDKIIIDLRRGVFADGQVYVALSRARSLDGIYLASEIKSYFIRTGNEIVKFATNFNNTEFIDSQIETNKLIYDLLNKKENDQAALVLFEKAYSYYSKMDISKTFETLNLALDVTICDDYLFNFMNNKQIYNSSLSEDKYHFVNAVFNLYKGNFEVALLAINKYIEENNQHINALYVKMRILSMINKWQEADMLIDKICELENQVIPKIYFRGGIINHCILDLPSIGIMQTLLSKYPKSIESFILIQQFCREKEFSIPNVEETENELLIEFNKEPLNPKFKKVLIENIKKNSNKYEEFYRILLNQVFE